MKLSVTAMENGIMRVSLSGRLDVQSAIEIDDEFTKLAKENKNLLVDLSDVTFIASLGIRTLVIGAKATANNGGKMILLNPQPNVEQVLRTSHIDTVMPITRDAATAAQMFGC
jgi:anti-sigma B factor antagonist